MSTGLTTFARRLILGGEKARSELDRPLLVWEVPVEENTDASWNRTKASTNADQPIAGEPLIFEVRKGEGKVNAFAQGVTVGRSDSNDVVLVDSSVSRFHAYFQKDRRSDRWTLIDAESKYGSAVDGKALVANEPCLLEDRCTIRFGQVSLCFYMPASFLAYIQKMVSGT